MSVIVIKRRKRGHVTPSGGEILWYGIAAEVPLGWSIVDATKDVFVRGCAVGDQTDTPDGNFTHGHTNPANTGAGGKHKHPISVDVGPAQNSTIFYRYPENEYYAGAGHGHPTGYGNTSEASDHTHSLSAPDPETVYPPYARLYWIKAVNNEILPPGGILMFDGTQAQISERFGAKVKLCDGNNGTPDLRDKFIYGASSDAHAKSTGGKASHTHKNKNTGSGGGHGHTASATVGAASASKGGSGYAGTSVSEGGHWHTVSGTVADDPAHTHPIGNTNSADHIPPYLKLYFVMRVAA